MKEGLCYRHVTRFGIYLKLFAGLVRILDDIMLPSSGGKIDCREE